MDVDTPTPFGCGLSLEYIKPLAAASYSTHILFVYTLDTPLRSEIELEPLSVKPVSACWSVPVCLGINSRFGYACRCRWNAAALAKLEN